QFAHFLDAARHGIERAEGALGVLGDDVSQGRFPRAGRAVEYQRTETVREQQATEQLARPEEMLLADEFLDGPRAHAGGERLRVAQVQFVDLAEQVHDCDLAVRRARDSWNSLHHTWNKRLSGNSEIRRMAASLAQMKLT